MCLQRTPTGGLITWNEGSLNPIDEPPNPPGRVRSTVRHKARSVHLMLSLTPLLVLVLLQRQFDQRSGEEQRTLVIATG